MRTLAAEADLPSTPTLKVRGCTAAWLVVDLTAAATGCVSMSGDSGLPGCGQATALRWFAKSAARGWQLVAAGGAKGCADVHASAPGFPTALCRSLPRLAAG